MFIYISCSNVYIYCFIQECWIIALNCAYRFGVVFFSKRSIFTGVESTVIRHLWNWTCEIEIPSECMLSTIEEHSTISWAGEWICSADEYTNIVECKRTTITKKRSRQLPGVNPTVWAKRKCLVDIKDVAKSALEHPPPFNVFVYCVLYTACVPLINSNQLTAIQSDRKDIKEHGYGLLWAPCQSRILSELWLRRLTVTWLEVPLLCPFKCTISTRDCSKKISIGL